MWYVFTYGFLFVSIFLILPSFLLSVYLSRSLFLVLVTLAVRLEQVID